jgi:hypothetical protein
MHRARRAIIAGIAFATVMALSQVATATPTKTYDIHFDGYCDGVQMNIPSVGLGTPGTVDGTQTGCVISGVIGSSASKAVRLTEDYASPGSIYQMVIGTATHTWTLYSVSGDLEYVVNSGTWSPGPPSGSGPSTAAGARMAGPASPAATHDIHFDGYCDGMTLNVPSAGLGTPGTVDGDHTGCITGGFFGTTSSGPTTLHISTTYGGSYFYEFVVNIPSKTWTIYGRNGNLITFINSGTWSPGPPSDGGPSAAG